MSKLSDLWQDCESAVFFGGAGVSTESGIPDFRSADGLYVKGTGTVPPEEILSATFFYSHTEEFYDFYREKMLYPDAKPCKAHKALAALERESILTLVATQNIDGLHQLAGSKNVAELHGTVLSNECLRCGARYGLSVITDTAGIPTCSRCGGLVKPRVTLYEEQLPDGVFERALTEIARTDMLIVGGTSLAVYPAAGLVRYFRGKYLVIINYQSTQADNLADLVIHESVGDTLEGLCNDLGISI